MELIQDVASGWLELPDSILLQIFSFLDHTDLGQVAQACQVWCRVAYDEHLWRDLARQKWKLQGVLASGKNSWRSEYKRLHYHLPVVCCKELECHTDEVLDVSFSHAGDMFCTTSKDVTVKVWKLTDADATLMYSDDLGLRLFWILTQYSCFNNDDTLLLVCGVKLPHFFTHDQDYDEPIGHGAIYSLEKNFQLMLVVPMDPPTLFGTWLDNVSCLGGYLDEANNTVTVKRYQVPAEGIKTQNCFMDDQQNIPAFDASAGETLFTFRGDPHHFMSLLLATLPYEPCPALDSDIVETSCDKLKRRFDACSTNQNKTDTSMKYNCSDKSPCKFDSASHSSFHSENTERYSVSDNMVQKATGISGHDIWDSDNKQMRKFVVFVTGQHTVIAIHEIRNYNFSDKSVVNKDEECGQQRIDKPDYILNFKDIYVIGLRLSKDNRYLYINARKRIEDADITDGWNLTLSEEIEIKAVDLQTLSVIPIKKLAGHKAFSSFPAWYICIDVCEDYVVSGSEDAKAYVWDRHYGQLLCTLDHTTGVVNGVCFSPVNPECLVTVGDDKTIKIWLSHNLCHSFKTKSTVV